MISHKLTFLGPDGDIENRGRSPRFSAPLVELENVNTLIVIYICINSTKYPLKFPRGQSVNPCVLTP